MASSKQPPKQPPKQTDSKLVVATRAGFYGQYREAGDEFTVPSELKASWFVDAKVIAKPAEGDAGDLV